jgi:NarL family two-component system response regulator LiaR
MTTRVLLVDDHAIVRAGLRGVLDAEPDLEVVGEAADGAAALWQAQRLRPDVVVTDLLLPDFDGIEATQRIRADLPQTQVVILTSVTEEADMVFRAVQAGAIGYILKNSEIETLVQTIRSAGHGQAQLSPSVAARLVQAMRSASNQESAPALTDRERDVLRQVAMGRINKEIAMSLRIAETTVKSHVSAVLDKLGVQSRTQAALHAVRSGLVSPDELDVSSRCHVNGQTQGSTTAGVRSHVAGVTPHATRYQVRRRD